MAEFGVADDFGVIHTQVDFAGANGAEANRLVVGRGKVAPALRALVLKSPPAMLHAARYDVMPIDSGPDFLPGMGLPLNGTVEDVFQVFFLVRVEEVRRTSDR